MPLTAKGTKILNHMEKEYGAKEGESVFYASKNKGKISGVDARDDASAKEKKLERLRNDLNSLKRSLSTPENVARAGGHVKLRDAIKAKEDEITRAQGDSRSDVDETEHRLVFAQPGVKAIHREVTVKASSPEIAKKMARKQVPNTGSPWRVIVHRETLPDGSIKRHDSEDDMNRRDAGDDNNKIARAIREKFSTLSRKAQVMEFDWKSGKIEKTAANREKLKKLQTEAEEAGREFMKASMRNDATRGGSPGDGSTPGKLWKLSDTTIFWKKARGNSLDYGPFKTEEEAIAHAKKNGVIVPAGRYDADYIKYKGWEINKSSGKFYAAHQSGDYSPSGFSSMEEVKRWVDKQSAKRGDADDEVIKDYGNKMALVKLRGGQRYGFRIRNSTTEYKTEAEARKAAEEYVKMFEDAKRGDSDTLGYRPVKGRAFTAVDARSIGSRMDALASGVHRTLQRIDAIRSDAAGRSDADETVTYKTEPRMRTSTTGSVIMEHNGKTVEVVKHKKTDQGYELTLRPTSDRARGDADVSYRSSAYDLAKFGEESANSGKSLSAVRSVCKSAGLDAGQTEIVMDAFRSTKRGDAYAPVQEVSKAQYEKKCQDGEWEAQSDPSSQGLVEVKVNGRAKKWVRVRDWRGDVIRRDAAEKTNEQQVVDRTLKSSGFREMDSIYSRGKYSFEYRGKPKSEGAIAVRVLVEPDGSWTYTEWFGAGTPDKVKRGRGPSGLPRGDADMGSLSKVDLAERVKRGDADAMKEVERRSDAGSDEEIKAFIKSLRNSMFGVAWPDVRRKIIEKFDISEDKAKRLIAAIKSS